MRINFYLLAFIFSFGLLAAPLRAEPLKPGVTMTLEKGGVFENKMYAGLRYTVSPGYKTYWKTPGYGGISPEINFSESQNLVKAEILWLPPKVKESFGLTNYVYDGDIVIPVEITPNDPALPVIIRWKANYGYCDKQCLPGEASGMLVQNAQDKLSENNKITASLAAVPKTIPENIKISDVTARSEGKNLLITFKINTDQELIGDKFIYEIGEPEFEISAPVVRKTGEGYDVAIETLKPEVNPENLTLTFQTTSGAAFVTDIPLTVKKSSTGE